MCFVTFEVRDGSMKRYLLVGFCLCLGLSGCSGGGASSSAPSGVGQVDSDGVSTGSASTQSESAGNTANGASVAVGDATGSSSVSGHITYVSPKVPAPTLAGAPANSAVVGSSYSFRPTVSSGGIAIVFSIKGQPAWMAFNASTGTLSGTPTASDVGLTPNITIVASDAGGTASIGPFVIRVSAAANDALAISGSPATRVVAGSLYEFLPSTTGATGGALRFSVQNAPSWAAFNAATGELSGVPTTASVGSSGSIIISVSDGKTSVKLAPFSVSVVPLSSSTVTVSWTPPSTGSDNVPAPDVAGYVIAYGPSASGMTQVVQVSDPTVNSYVIGKLSAGQWFFSVAAYTSAGVSGIASAVHNTMVP